MLFFVKMCLLPILLLLTLPDLVTVKRLATVVLVFCLGIFLSSNDYIKLLLFVVDGTYRRGDDTSFEFGGVIHLVTAFFQHLQEFGNDFESEVGMLHLSAF